MKNIKSALYQKYQDILFNELKNLYLSDLQGIIQYNYLQHVNALLLGLITTSCSEFNIPYKDLFIDGTIPLDIIRNLETVEEMLLWFTEKFYTLIKAIEAISNVQYSRQVRIIVQYIKEHYHEHIGLESISQLFNLHKVQLARLFKKNTGISVNGYIRKFRIQESKTLLQNSTHLCLIICNHTKWRIKYYYKLHSLRVEAAFHAKVILMSYTQLSIRSQGLSYWRFYYVSLCNYILKEHYNNQP